MPFFHQYQPQSLAQEQQEQEMDLFQLLSLLSSSNPTQPQEKQCTPRRHIRKQTPATPTFIPAFDILETASGYELFGEVPGLDIKTLDIQFSDAQTLVLKGVTGRGTPSPVQKQAEQVPEKVAEKVEDNTKGKQATVSDDEEEYDEVDTPLTNTNTPPANTTTTDQKAEVKEDATKKAQAPAARYWLTERKVGSFARSFSFAQRIEWDDVKAELKEGILHVVVPKSEKSRKVDVSVF